MNNITVFSGLSKDNTENGFKHCEEIGKIIATKGYTMICAGASFGCQSNLINAALYNNGKVIAVTVPMFANELLPVLKDTAIISSEKDLSERKKIMKSMTDYGYIILPGGPGTLDELWEVISEKAEDINDGKKKKIIIVNTDGFYEPVKKQFQIMNEIFNWKYDEDIIFINEPNELNDILPTVGGGGDEKGGRRHIRKTKKNKTSKYTISKRKTRK